MRLTPVSGTHVHNFSDPVWFICRCTKQAVGTIVEGKRNEWRDRESEFLPYWRTGFDDAFHVMESSQGNIHRIADYCLANLDRDIPGTEVVAACGL
jgi:hypothetical protein